MRNVRRLMAAALLPAIVFIAAGTATVFGSPQGKQDLCHLTGTGGYHVINVSLNAVPAHLRHGDILTDEYGACP
jgi:hypothetical protein